jgi:uncharacterized protein YyaL (SSP411 family)
MTEDPVSCKAESGDLRQANRLISERSPYLLQHAYNPVQWYPWGEEAFKAARKANKPVFLSVGYSTCHWCHVMAHESFEDPGVAALMNETFVCIKVDREERPDIDQIYMAVALKTIGRGGWPLTIIMTTDKRPFFAATYIPKNGRFGQIGLMELIPKIKELWINNREELLGSADRIMDNLRMDKLIVAQRAKSPGKEMDASSLAQGYEELASIYDAQNGGFGIAPKFPTPHNLLFLLRHWRRSKDENALAMVETTLQAMRMGGIYDQVGFGFHRYSTDAKWFVPHFEKMLYDQALLAMAYVEVYQTTGKKEYARTAREVLEYVLRDMTSSNGGFYSAEDADSEGEEGKFYLWTAEKLRETLEKEELQMVVRLYDVHEQGNFEKGRNILRLRSSREDAAAVLKISEQELQSRLEKIRLKLFVAREMRIRPWRDDKILTDWNGLMIAALSRAAQALDEPRYAAAAKKAADFILEKMQTPEGRLLHRYRGEAGIQASLDDYAFLIWGLIDLYETFFEVGYLKAALKLNQVMLQHFWDGILGGLFFTPDDGETILLRQKEFRDGAVPSGNSAAMLNLLRLSRLTGDPSLEEKSRGLARALTNAEGQSMGHTMLLCALDFAFGPSSEIALVGSLDDEALLKMLRAIRSRFLPNKVVVVVSGIEIGKMASFTESLIQLEGRVTAYICSGHRCLTPTTDPEKIIDLLEKTG